MTAELITKRGADESGLERLAADQGQRGSDAALWMLLLLRLTSVTADKRLELRNGAIQTLLRIFDAYGDRLSAEAWSACVESVLFRLLSSLETELGSGEKVAESERAEWHGTAVVVLDGISGLLANYLDMLTAHHSFNRLWSELLGHLARLLDFQVLDINTATFQALTHILSRVGDEKSGFDETSIDRVWDLWSRGIPTSKRPLDASAKADNQDCLVAYVAALRRVYALLQDSMTVERVGRMLMLLCESVEQASTGSYVLDVEHATPLQTQVLAAVEMIRTDVDGVPSAVVSQVADFVTLAYDKDRAGDGAKRTFVAMSKASMTMLQAVISSHASVKEMYTSGALAAALSALCKPIALKYRFPIVTRSSPPWRVATRSALKVLGATLPQLAALGIPKETAEAIWAMVVRVADGILGADADGAPSESDGADDEEFDIESFHKLRALIVPSLGGEAVKDQTRRAYAESLFRASMMHEISAADRCLVDRNSGDVDAASGAKGKPASLHTLPAGRTTAAAPTRRMRLAYVAFDELFSLVAAGGGDDGPYPAAAGPRTGGHSSWRVLQLRMANTAAPLLLLRCALVMRAYAADQPLRGKMPQPLSQRKEMLWTLRRLVELESEGEATAASSGGRGRGRRHLLELYPLIVRSLAVQGDREVQRLLGEALEVVGGEMGIV